MAFAEKLALLKEMLESAEASIRSAKQIMNELTKVKGKAAEKMAQEAAGLNMEESSRGKVIEGIFDGQNMIGPDSRSYPVPANYASKSKLIPGDLLKLTITDEGSFIYKQIGPIERRRVIGVLTFEDGHYKVLGEGKAYRVLLASVTYYHGEVGDEVTLIVPAVGDSQYGSIDNVIPKSTKTGGGNDAGENLEMERF